MRLTAYAGIFVAFVGCSYATTEPEVVFNPTGAPTVQFNVPDMMCADGCGVKTKEILSKVSGAKDVIVDFDTKTATVAIEEGEFDAQQAVAALVDHGFDHSTLKDGATKTSAAQAVATPATPPAMAH